MVVLLEARVGPQPVPQVRRLGLRLPARREAPHEDRVVVGEQQLVQGGLPQRLELEQFRAIRSEFINEWERQQVSSLGGSPPRR